MRRVTAVDMDGNIMQREDERIGHNEIVYEMFKEFLNSIQDKELKGDWYIKFGLMQVLLPNI